ncbi:MAG: hypothetical protein ACAI44_22430, partial [Candidatus Sericytochromatia bacterium]
MSGVDGRVTGLNAQVYQALTKINTRDGISKEEAQQIATAINADDHVDAAESDLLDELFSNTNAITIQAEGSEFSPVELKFVENGAPNLAEGAETILAQVKLKALVSEEPHGEAPHVEGEHPSGGHVEGEHPHTADGTLHDVKHYQHLFHELHLGAEVAEKVGHFLAHSHALQKVMDFLPDSMKGKVIEMLAEVAGKYGPKALHSLEKCLTSKLMQGFVLGADAIGAGYYGALATGLNYPNHQVDGVEYEVRPSARTKALAGMTAGIYAGSFAANAAMATGAGAPLKIALSVASLIGGAITDWSLERDTEILENVVKNVMGAKNGEELQRGIQNLTDEYGSLADVQQVLGQVGVHQNDGTIVKLSDKQTDAVDRDLAGAVATRIMESAIKGEIPADYAREKLADLLSGVGERWTSDDDVAQSFVNQIFLKFGKNEEAFSKAIGLLGSDVRLKLFNMLDGGITWGETGSQRLDGWLNEHHSDMSEAKVMEVLANAETNPATRGHMIGSLLDGATRGRFEDLAFKLIEKTRNAAIEKAAQTGGKPDFTEFRTLLNNIRTKPSEPSLLSEITNELSPERAGKIMAWMVQAGASKEQLDAYAAAIRGTENKILGNDDDVTREFMKEFQTLNKDLPRAEYLKKVEGLSKVMNQDSIKHLFDSLESMWTDTGDHELIEDLAHAANPDTKAYMIQKLIDCPTFARSESVILKILTDSSPADRKKVFDKLNLKELGGEMENPKEAARILKELADVGLSDKGFRSFLSGVKSQVHLFDANDDDTALEVMKTLGNDVIAKLPEESKLKLFNSLSLQEFWETSRFRGEKSTQMDKLLGMMSPESKGRALNGLVRDGLDSARQDLLYKHMTAASPQDFKKIIAEIDTAKLAGQITDPARFNSLDAKIRSSGNESKLTSYYHGAAANNLKEAWHAMSWADGNKLPDSARLEIFKKMVDSGNFSYAQHMISGDSAHGLRKAGNATQREMAAYISSRVTNFSNASEAGKAAAWVMAYGSQANIDTAFSQISGKWFGKGGEIVKAAIDQAKADGLDIKGKLSLDTLKSMMGSLNTAWTKAFGDYAGNLNYVRELASLTNTAGKTAII